MEVNNIQNTGSGQGPQAQKLDQAQAGPGQGGQHNTVQAQQGAEQAQQQEVEPQDQVQLQQGVSLRGDEDPPALQSLGATLRSAQASQAPPPAETPLPQGGTSPVGEVS